MNACCMLPTACCVEVWINSELTQATFYAYYVLRRTPGFRRTIVAPIGKNENIIKLSEIHDAVARFNSSFENRPLSANFTFTFSTVKVYKCQYCTMYSIFRTVCNTVRIAFHVWNLTNSVYWSEELYFVFLRSFQTKISSQNISVLSRILPMYPSKPRWICA